MVSTHSLTQSLTHSLTHSLTQVFNHSLTYSLKDPLMRSALVQNAHSDLLDSHTTITVLGHDYKVIKSIINEGRKIHKMMKASGPRETLIYIQSSGRSSTWDNDLNYGSVILSPICLHTYLLVPLFTQVLVQEG